MLTSPLSREQEAVIVARCQRGDRAAFARIVEEFSDLLFGSAVLMTRDRPLAQDMVQETLISAWKSFGTFDADRPLKPWLMRILVNHVRMYKRRKRPKTSAASLSIEATELSTEMELVESRDTLRRALANLTEDQREVIVLRYFADFTIPEIAEATRRRQGTVRSRLQRAIERMREVVAKEEE